MGSIANLLISMKYEIDHFILILFLKLEILFYWKLWASSSQVFVFLDLRLALQKKNMQVMLYMDIYSYLSRSDIFMLFQLISFNLQFHTYLYAVCIQLVEFLVPRFRFLTILYLIWHQLILFCTYIVIFHHDPSRYNVSF